VDGVLVACASFDLGEFVFGAGEADLQSFDFAEAPVAVTLAPFGGVAFRVCARRRALRPGEGLIALPRRGLLRNPANRRGGKV